MGHGMGVEQCFRHTCERCGTSVQSDWSEPSDAHTAAGRHRSGWETVTVGRLAESRRRVYLCPLCVQALESVKAMYVDNIELAVTDQNGVTTTFGIAAV